MNYKLFNCKYCHSTWKIDIDAFKNNDECPFCHKKINEEKYFGYELKKIILIYGEDILLNPNKFYSLVVDLIKDYDDEKRLLKKVLPTGLISILYNNKDNKDEIDVQIERIHHKDFLDIEVLYMISEYILYALDIIYKKDAKEIIKKEENDPTRLLEDYYQEALKCEKNKDFVNAFSNYEYAAERGHSIAQYHLGICYLKGIGVEKDEKLSTYWFKKSAMQEYVEGEFMLAVSYFLGIGIEKNLKMAFYWFEKAANKGSSAAKNYLGMMFEHGFGTSVNHTKAFFWYNEAAKDGSLDGLFNVGRCLELGIGVNPDIKRAHFYYEKAARGGHKEALKKMKK